MPSLVRGWTTATLSVLWNDKHQFSKVTGVQNAAARTVCQTARRQHHLVDLLKDLHWLYVHGRVDYKIAVLCYKAVKLQQPSYLTGLLSSYRQSHVLRSSTSDLLSVQSSWTNMAVCRFSRCTPTVWNSLPSFVRTADSFTGLSSRHMFCLQDICSRASDTLIMPFAHSLSYTYIKM